MTLETAILTGKYSSLYKESSSPISLTWHICNRKGWASVNCLAVVNSSRKFVYFECRWPGSVNDKRLLRISALADLAEIPVGRYVLADAGFRLTQKCVTPFTHQLTPAQERYNEAHSQTRVVVENTFGVWKARFRSLGLRVNNSIEHVPMIVYASAILHNVCESHNDVVEPDWIIHEAQAQPSQPHNEAPSASGPNDAINQRIELMENIMAR